MSPASYLAAPPRDAAGGIASRGVTYGWGALGFLLVAAGGGGAFAGLRALAAWRELSALQRRLTPALAGVSAGLAAADERAAALPPGVDELAAAQARLAESLAR